MSSLEASVLLLAGVAILVVAGYNLWLLRARSAGRRAARRADAAEARTDAQRVEPRFGAQQGGGAGGAAALDALTPLAGELSGETQRGGAPVLDARVDCIVEWRLHAPAGGERLLHWLQGQRRAGGKPIVVEAAEDAAAGADGAEAAQADPSGAAAAPAWELPAPGRRYRFVRIGVLLANRHGPLNAMEFTEFVGTVQALAEQLAVLPDTPDMSAVLARAREIDQTCEKLDAQVGLGVEAPEVLGIGDLARLAAECGCEERGNNRHVRLTDLGEQLFSLALADAPNRLSLLLDVPRAPASRDPWGEMLECAQLCAQRLGGALTDDGGRVLSPPQLERIGQLIAQRQRELEEAGFVPGSPLALRVFN